MAKPSSQTIVRYAILLLIVVLALLSLSRLPRAHNSETNEAMPQLEGQAEIGGDFTLKDQNGKIVHARDFHGRPMLVFFGFTHCPDICPIATATLSKALGLMGDKADKVSALFITIDPKRDTPAVLKEYLSSFDSHLTGLTGTQKQIQNVASAYKVYFAKNKVPWGEDDDHDADSKPESGDNYTLDHSAFIYLMDKNGKYVTHFSSDASPSDIVKAVEGLKS